MLPHNIRYQQEKRTKRSTLLHEYEALYSTTRNKDLENGLQVSNETDENGIEKLAYRLATPGDGEDKERKEQTLFEASNPPIWQHREDTRSAIHRHHPGRAQPVH